ncbi:hypothetical protein [Bradyrhizobium valentinum]|nr:hypothetical protein [Bradyrhizobium valentinum]
MQANRIAVLLDVDHALVQRNILDAPEFLPAQAVKRIARTNVRVL